MTVVDEVKDGPTNHGLRNFGPEPAREQPMYHARRLVADLEDVIADAKLVRDNLAEACTRGLSDSAGGVSGGGERVGGTKDFTESMLRRTSASGYDAKPDMARMTLSTMVEGIVASRTATRRAAAASLHLIALSREKADLMLDDGPVPCRNCGRDVWRTPRDRLIGGACEACDRYKRRNGIERPRELWENQMGGKEAG